MTNKIITTIFISIIIFCVFSGCNSTKICSYDGCNEKVDSNNLYCFDHTCLFCENVSDGDSHYCDIHRCEYNGRFGRCKHGITGYYEDKNQQYCDNHKNLDLVELGEAEDIASEWCWTIAAGKRGSTFSPFSFNGEFYTTDTGYYFEVYDNDFYKYGYVIVTKENGDLHCDGMRYK